VKTSISRTGEGGPDESGETQESEQLRAVGFAFLDLESESVSLADSIRASQGTPAEEVAAALDQATKENPVLKALSPIDSVPIGQGEEAICFDLPSVRRLLKDSVFANMLNERLQESTQLRAALLRDIPDDAPAYATLDDAVDRQVECILQNLPESMVVKVVRPDGGSWDSSWGNREFDAPIYYMCQLDEIDYYVVVQEKVLISSNTAEMKAALPKGFELYDAIGRQQEEGEHASGTGQFGYNQHGRPMLIDYGAVGPTGGAGNSTLMTSYRTGDEFDDYDEVSAGEESSSGLYEFSDIESSIIERQQRALSGEGEFWAIDSHRVILQGLIEEAQGACKLPEEDSIEQLVLLRALELSDSACFDEYQEEARSEIEQVVFHAIAERILLRNSD
jgi:hypothetical protein